MVEMLSFIFHRLGCYRQNIEKAVYGMWKVDFYAEVCLPRINLSWQKHAKTIQGLLCRVLVIILTSPRSTVSESAMEKQEGIFCGPSILLIRNREMAPSM